MASELFGEETGIDVMAMPVLHDAAFRMAARTALKLGAKVPPAAMASALASTAGSAAAAGLSGGGARLPVVQELRPHWQVIT